MNSNRIYLRYATALFEFAEERNEVEQTFNDVKLLADICEKSRELRLMLKSPVVFTDKKLSVLHEILKDKIGIVTSTFIDILVRKRREEHLHGIAVAFVGLYRKSKNIKVARVISAVPLDESIKNDLITILVNQTGSTIWLEEEVDKSILGGLIVNIEGIKFDDSISNKIQTLRKEFSVNKYIKEY